MNRADFQQLAETRIADAEALLNASRWGAAYYLAGYAVEFALKACIAKLTRAEEFPDKTFGQRCWTHDLKILMALAGLETQFAGDRAADPLLSASWGAVNNWNESTRYSDKTEAQARELYAAITDAKGVLPWIKRHW